MLSTPYLTASAMAYFFERMTWYSTSDIVDVLWDDVAVYSADLCSANGRRPRVIASTEVPFYPGSSD